MLPDAQIELTEIPSKNPGVAGHRGASPKQIEFQREFFAQQRRIYAASGANQSGKTNCVAGMCFCKWLRDKARDGDIYWVIAKTAETIRDIPHRSLWQYLPRRMFGDVQYAPKLGFGMIATLHLLLPGNRGKCEVWFKTEEQDLISFESARLNGIWWTECSREVLFDALLPRMAARRGWLLMDFVPLEPWHRDKIKIPAETGNRDLFHARFCMKDNAHNLPEGEIDFQRRQMSTSDAKVRIDGEDGAIRGIIYPEFDENKHVVEPFAIPVAWPKWRCLDYGYHTSATAMLWGTVSPIGWVAPWGERMAEEVLWVYREYYTHSKTPPQHVEAIKVLSGNEQYVGGVVCDPAIYSVTQSNLLSVAQELEMAGLFCQPGVRTSTVGEHALLSMVRRWFEAGKIRFFKPCNNAIREHRTWRVKRSSDGVFNDQETPERGNNHTCDALKELVACNPCHSFVGGVTLGGFSRGKSGPLNLGLRALSDASPVRGVDVCGGDRVGAAGGDAVLPS